MQIELKNLLPDALHSLCVTERHPKGKRLFETGKRPAFMFFVHQGEVTLERIGIQGEPIILQRTRQGFVGEASLQSAHYHCDAKVVTNSAVTKIPIRELQEALETDPSFSMRWIAMLNLEVRRLRLQCERLTLKTVETRLLHLLESEGQETGYPLGAGLKSIAGEIGVTHEALYRCVASLEKRSILRRTDERLFLIVERSFQTPFSIH